MKLRLMVIAAIVAVYTAGFFSGIGLSTLNSLTPRENLYPITIEEAGEILALSARSHQYYIDYPFEDYRPDGVYLTRVKFHQGCVDRYNQVWDLIQRLSGVVK